MSTPEADPALTSSDSTHSTVEEATDLPETNPPMGPQVIETRGLPAEVTPAAKKSTKAES